MKPKSRRGPSLSDLAFSFASRRIFALSSTFLFGRAAKPFDFEAFAQAQPRAVEHDP